MTSTRRASSKSFANRVRQWGRIQALRCCCGRCMATAATHTAARLRISRRYSQQYQDGGAHVRGQPQAAHVLNKLSAEYMVKEKERKAKAVSGKKRPMPEEAPDHEEEDSGSSPSPWEDSDDGDM